MVELSSMVGEGLQSSGLPLVGILGAGLKAAPGIGILASMLGNAGGSSNGIFSLDTLKNIAKKGIVEGLIEPMFSGSGAFDAGGLYSDYLALGGIDGSAAYTSTGKFTGRGRGASTSGTITNQQKETTNISITGSDEYEAKTIDDLYNLVEGFPEVK